MCYLQRENSKVFLAILELSKESKKTENKVIN
jgi:hypothetical protein